MPTPWDYTTTPPQNVDYVTADAGTGAAPAHSNPAALTNVAPGDTNPAALTNVAPASSNPAALSAAAPNHSNPAPYTTTPPGIINPDGSTPGLPSMPATFIPSFIELTGGGNALNTLNANAADATANKIVQGTVGGQLKSYQVRAGTDAQDLPGIVHPANYDPVINAVVFVEL